MDIVEQMRSFESDHEPDGWPAIQMKQVSALCDEVERLQSLINGVASEVERLQSLLEQERQESLTAACRVAALEMELDSAHPITAQQSLAVVVPDDWNAQCTCGNRWHAVMPTENCPSCNPSPRITEQDAREFAASVIRYCNTRKNVAWGTDSYMRETGRDLLTKLNEAKHD